MLLRRDFLVYIRSHMGYAMPLDFFDQMSDVLGL